VVQVELVVPEKEAVEVLEMVGVLVVDLTVVEVLETLELLELLELVVVRAPELIMALLVEQEAVLVPEVQEVTLLQLIQL
jgi:hypothetical protein